MFKFLKEKLGNWVKNISKEKKEEEEAAELISEKRKQKEEKRKIREKEVKKEKKKRSAEEIKEERDVTDQVIEDIKKEKAGEEIKPLPRPEEFEEGKIIVEEEKEKSEDEVSEEEITEELEEEKPEEEQEEEEKDGFFKKIFKKITKVKISEKEFDVYSEGLEMILIENNVALEVAEKIIKKLKEKVVGKELLKKEIEKEIMDSLRDIIEEILVEPFDIISRIADKTIKNEPCVILFCGINGSGKTTTIAKVANFLKKKKISCVIAAADTFRAASIEQLKKHGESLGIKIISSEYGSDPASVGFDAINYAKKNHINCVLIDTAGRMHTAKNLLMEMEKIVRVCKPDIKIFVGESITGNDAIEQVKSFDDAIKIDGIILSKADIDEKGGTALSVGYITKKPILYLGTGQEYEKIELFDKRKFTEKLGL